MAIAVWFVERFRRRDRLRPTAVFSFGALWLRKRGFQGKCSRRRRWAAAGRGIRKPRLVVYRVPGPNGETSPGKRCVTLAWYDASRTQWLRDRRYLVGAEVMESVLPSDIDDDLRVELLAISRKRWRGAAREIIATALEHKVIFGTPLAEYLPDQLVTGRLARVGDAAHVASPMVGAGFASGLQDGTAFITAVRQSGGVAGRAGSQALHRYNEVRLAPNRRRVLESLAETLAPLSSTVAS
jgi:2-polyprenyl-6-methoxyphenol hydroxylase-like FAD-dependent oxidoreductase